MNHQCNITSFHKLILDCRDPSEMHCKEEKILPWINLMNNVIIFCVWTSQELEMTHQNEMTTNQQEKELEANLGFCFNPYSNRVEHKWHQVNSIFIRMLGKNQEMCFTDVLCLWSQLDEYLLWIGLLCQWIHDTATGRSRKRLWHH